MLQILKRERKYAFLVVEMPWYMQGISQLENMQYGAARIIIVVILDKHYEGRTVIAHWAHQE